MHFTDAGNKRFEPESHFSPDSRLVNREAKVEPEFAGFKASSCHCTGCLSAGGHMRMRKTGRGGLRHIPVNAG